ncbi:MAG: hypothetical protein K0U78_12685, partial [Actinomycetia bacterium]|nr:hypothetical protein [Actinomycetes bacterium]
QSLLSLASITPSGTPDEVGASQYLQSLIELSAGRAITYDDSGVADAYILDVQANQHTPDKLFDGMVLKFVPGNDCTGGACTADPFGVGATNVRMFGGLVNPPAKQIKAGIEAELVYRTLPAIHLELKPRVLAFATGSHTFVGVVAGTQAGEIAVTHGLVTDDIDFGGTIYSNAGTVPGSTVFPVGKIIGTDNRTAIISAGGVPTGANGSPAMLNAPLTGDFRMNAYNNEPSLARDITINWWARERL